MREFWAIYWEKRLNEIYSGKNDDEKTFPDTKRLKTKTQSFSV